LSFEFLLGPPSRAGSLTIPPKTHQPIPSDIFICSYPKSGTTWAQAMVRALITLRPTAAAATEAAAEAADWHITEYCPFFEADRTWNDNHNDEEAEAEAEPFAPPYHRRQRETGRRAFNTHLRWDMMPTAQHGPEAARFLYLVRDGRDVAVSYYHHMRSMVRLVCAVSWCAGVLVCWCGVIVCMPRVRRE
jgi:sulfotransferase